MKYAVIQIGYGHFGIGDTIEAAKNDAREWLDRDTDIESIPIGRAGLNHGDLCVIDENDTEFNDYVSQ